MGVVYLAEHPLIGKKVALKAPHPELSRNAEVVSRFVTEAKAVNQIGHEHIVDIADFGTTPEGEFYFIMEYLQGEALSDRLKREVPLDATRAMVIAAQIADALDASHERGVIHRDLKPENIFLLARGSGDDFVKVLDFGIAKLTGAEEKVSHRTCAGTFMGTPSYMAPEQCEGKIEIDARADIYSLGVLLFEMLTGKVPFGGEGYGEIIVKQIMMPPPSLRSIVPELSPELDLILFRALAKDRAQRFQTMGELRDALLDPHRYALSAHVGELPADPPGVARATPAMARREVDSSGTSPADAESDGVVRQLASASSTLSQAMGEIMDDLTPRKRTGRVVLLFATAAITCAIGAGLRSSTGEAHQAVSVTGRPTRLATTRLNLNSDPAGALVGGADGKILGQTPISIEVPTSDSAVAYTFNKQGFEAKTIYIVPNLPSSVFATMYGMREHPTVSQVAVPQRKPPPATLPWLQRRPKSPPSKGKPEPDRDDVLELSHN